MKKVKFVCEVLVDFDGSFHLISIYPTAYVSTKSLLSRVENKKMMYCESGEYDTTIGDYFSFELDKFSEFNVFSGSGIVAYTEICLHNDAIHESDSHDLYICSFEVDCE